MAYVGQGIKKAYEEKIIANGLHPLRIAMECGRMITGPVRGTWYQQFFTKKKYIRIM